MIKNIPEEEIFKLRRDGNTYQEITDHFNNKGINISLSTIRTTCIKIYKEKGLTEPKYKRKKSNIYDEEIYKLRKSLKTYEQIQEEFLKKGIKISISVISSRCKSTFKQKGEIEPKSRFIQKKHDYDDEIYFLRKNRYTYKQIADHLKQNGINLTVETIRTRCKNIFLSKNEPEPSSAKYNIDTYDEIIFKLRKARFILFCNRNAF